MADAKMVRLRRLLKATKQARKLYSTNVLPGVQYGTEVTAISDQDVAAERTRVAVMYGHPRASRDVLFALQPHLDPAPKLTQPAIVRYAEEWWRTSDREGLIRHGRVLQPNQLLKAFANAKVTYDSCEPPRGLVGRMLWMLEWVGWTIP